MSIQARDTYARDMSVLGAGGENIGGAAHGFTISTLAITGGKGGYGWLIIQNLKKLEGLF
jgi:hypothetical protein